MFYGQEGNLRIEDVEKGVKVVDPLIKHIKIMIYVRLSFDRNLIVSSSAMRTDVNRFGVQKNKDKSIPRHD